MSYFKINKIDAIDSTNMALKRQYHESKIMHGELLWALDQQKGKGQRENQWVSEPNKNLTFSFFLSPEKLNLPTVFVLNCWVALAVRSALISFGIPAVSIKWPNDILSENKKICGLLIENLYRGSKYNGSIVGIGLNVNQLADISFYLTSGITVSDSFSAFNKTLFCLGEKRSFIAEGQAFQATVDSVNEQGELVLKTADGQFRTFQYKTVEWVY
jgi:biotin-[acetyl-CoA-carboxylase] ligase BirA-like protein